MPRRSPLLAAGACGTLALSAPGLHAQGSVVLEGFAARAQASTDARFGGLGLTAYSGPFGLRVSGALNVFRAADAGGQSGDYPYDPGFGGSPYGCRHNACGGYGAYGGSSSSLRVGAWMADADLVFEPLRTFAVGRALLLGFSPYAFAGVGYSAVRPVGVPDTGSASVSYGLGVRHQLLGWLGVTGEARFRRAFHDDSVLSSVDRRSTQYRVGLTISFGGRHRARAAVAAPAVPPAPAATPASPDALLVTPNASMASVGARVVPRVLDLADSFVDTPYRPGGATPGTGFDAPGFVQYVYGHEGVSLPRRVSQLAASGMTVSTTAGSLRPGDLVFFSNDGTVPDHVAIYAGANRIIHATASGGGVRYDVLGQGPRGEWFASHLVAARRVADGSEDRARPQGNLAPHTPGELARPDQAPAPAGGTPAGGGVR